MQQSLLVISALGEDRPGIVDALSGAITDCGCNIADSRMSVLGGEFAMLLLLSGNWDAIAKIENALPRLREKLKLTLSTKRTEARKPKQNTLSYMAEVISMDHPGIVHDVARFFSVRNINIEDLYTNSYPAPHTGTLMFSMNMSLSVPGDTSIATLRGEFMDFCDSLNLDAMLGPMK
ncbi:MAG: glycine cleavage system protein R [Gammaproteobacteria bacterium]|nr:glycine cleavage system protein R [Gammaproteobacteria bacterium]